MKKEKPLKNKTRLEKRLMNDNYEKFKSNDLLKSVVNNSPFLIMKSFFGKRYLEYRKRWCNPYQNCDFPIHIDVDLQDSCNMKCNMCHQSYRNRTNNIMDLTLIKRIIKEGEKKGLCAINFGASGEPLLQKELLLKSISLASKSNIMDIFIHTNGVLLDESFSSKLLNSNLKHLCVSIDAFSEGIYEKTRNSRNFQKVVNNVLKFIELRNDKKQSIPIIRVSFCVNPLNYKEKNYFLDFWRNKADLIELQNYRHLNDKIVVTDSFKVKNADCKNPFRRIMVWPNGDVSLCCGYRSDDVLLGNMIKDKVNLNDLWNNKKMENIRTAFKGKGLLPKTCRVCLNSNYAIEDN